MLVYRIEHETNKLGPYCNGLTDQCHYSEKRCPDPWEDGIKTKKNYSIVDVIYGFKSKKDLVNWFGKDFIRSFSYNKCHVYAYRVPDDQVCMGSKHLGFNSAKGMRVRRVFMYEFN